jgi:ATP-dependent Clp protease ATP-binding subunit ClpB
VSPPADLGVYLLEIIQELAGEENYSVMKQAVMEVVGSHFRPEFINRIDESVVFHPLGRAHIRSIAKIQLLALEARLKERDIKFSISDAALDKIGEMGFDPVYGARPLKRSIQQELENPLAQAILSGKFSAGDTIQVDVKDDQLYFVK